MLKGFTTRERRLALVLIACATIICAYTLLIRPARARLATLHRVIPQKQNDLEQLTVLSKKVKKLQTSLDAIHQKILPQRDLTVMPALEKRLAAHNLFEAAEVTRQTRPVSEDVVESAIAIQFNSISINDLVEFLSDLKGNGNPLRLKNLHIERHRESENLINASVTTGYLFQKAN